MASGTVLCVESLSLRRIGHQPRRGLRDLPALRRCARNQDARKRRDDDATAKARPCHRHLSASPNRCRCCGARRDVLHGQTGASGDTATGSDTPSCPTHAPSVRATGRTARSPPALRVGDDAGGAIPSDRLRESRIKEQALCSWLHTLRVGEWRTAVAVEQHGESASRWPARSRDTNSRRIARGISATQASHCSSSRSAAASGTGPWKQATPPMLSRR